MTFALSALQVRANFRPEFVNRVDEFVVFEALKKDEIKHIVRLQVQLSQQAAWCVWLEGCVMSCAPLWCSACSFAPSLLMRHLPCTPAPLECAWVSCLGVMPA